LNPEAGEGRGVMATSNENDVLNVCWQRGQAESPTWIGVNPVGIQSIRGRLPSGLGGHWAVAVDTQSSRDGRDRRGSNGRRGAGSWGGESDRDRAE
jgi:hypothetical protein